MSTGAAHNLGYTVMKLTADAYAQTNPEIGIPLDGSRPFSVDAWVKLNGLCANASILSKEGVFNLGIQGRAVCLEIDGYPPVLSDTGKQPLGDEAWHYICVTYAAGQTRIYVDGQFNIFQNIFGSGSTSGQPYLIGNGLQAQVWSVRVYNTALDQDAVLRNMYNDPEAGTIVANFDFSQNPPRDTGPGDLPITLENRAEMVTKVPALALSGTGYAVPFRDEEVNPGGYQTDPYTVQAWVYIASADNPRQAIFVNSDLDQDTGMSLFLQYDTAAQAYRVKSLRGSNAAETNILTSTGTVPMNTWTNVATTYDGAKLAIYINGALDTSGEFGPIPNVQMESTLLIGAALAQGEPLGATFFQGYIARVDVWSRALTAQEVGQYMAAAPGLLSEGLEAVYDFSDTNARNSVLSHPVGLVDGALLDYQVSRAMGPRGREQGPPITHAPLDHETLQSILGSLQLSDFAKEYGDRLDDLLQADLEQAVHLVDPAAREAVRDKLTIAWGSVRRALEKDPSSLPFLVTSHVVGDDYVLLCHSRIHGTYVAYRAPAASVDPCIMWKVQLVFVLIAGILDALFGVPAKLSDRAVTFIVEKVLKVSKIQALMGAGTGLTAAGVFGIAKALYNAGLLGTLIKMLLDLGLWAVLRIAAKAVLTFAGVGAADLIASLVATAAIFVKTYLEKPRDCDALPRVSLAAISFNYDPTAQAADAMTIRRDYTQKVDTPEWVPGRTRAEESPAAYSIQSIAGKTVTIQAKFFINTTDPVTVQVRASGGGLLGDIDSFTVTFRNGVSTPEFVTVPLNHQQIAAGGVNRQDITWTWGYQLPGSNWTPMATTQHRIYVVLALPTSPWVVSSNRSNSQLPWTAVLDYACQWAKGKTNATDAATAITQAVNGTLRLTYDRQQGAPAYALSDAYGQRIFLCSEFLDYLSTGAGKGNTVNCSDCATVVTTFANILGCDLTESTMFSWNSGGLEAFKCNKIIAIGGSDWEYPFPPGNQFAFHEVAWTGATSYTDNIYDACLQVDSSDNPWDWSSPTGHTPKLPANMPFTTLEIQPSLPIATPFTDQCYRERLAQNTAEGIGRCVPQGSWPYSQNGRRRVV